MLGGVLVFAASGLSGWTRGGDLASSAGMLVFTVLAPVFLLIALGAGLQRIGFVSREFLKEANRVTYWLGLPALLFSELATSLHSPARSDALLAALLGATVATMALGYLVAWLLRVPGAAMGTFVQGSSRGNLAFIGLPIVFALPDVPVIGELNLRAAAVLIVAPTMVFYNLSSVTVLLLSQHKFGWQMFKPFVRQLLTTPPLIAIAAGFLWAWSGWPLPGPIAKSFEFLGEMALPLGLLGVGGALVTVKLGANWRVPAAAALVKTVGGPLCGWGLARLGGFEPAATTLLMLLLATPTAVVSYAVALELKGDEAIASGTIVLSTFTSLAVLAGILAWSAV